MKNVVLITVYMLVAALTFGILMTLHGREARSVELESSLSSIVEETVENMMLEKNYKIENYNEFVADFIENLSEELDTESDILVNIIKADKEKGILSIEVTEQYSHLNGNEGSVKCIKTVIFNKIPADVVNSYEIRFYLSKSDMLNEQNCYKSCLIMEGDFIAAPADPLQEGEQFDGWKDVNGYLADFTQPVAEERAYYAEWKR